MVFTYSGSHGEQSHLFFVIYFAHFWHIFPQGTPWPFPFLSSPAHVDVHPRPQQSHSLQSLVYGRNQTRPLWIIAEQTNLFREQLHCRSSWAQAHIFVCAQPMVGTIIPCAAIPHSTWMLTAGLQHSSNTQPSCMCFSSAAFPQVFAPVPLTLPPSQLPLKLDYYCLSIIYLFVCSLL